MLCDHVNMDENRINSFTNNHILFSSAVTIIKYTVNALDAVQGLVLFLNKLTVCSFAYNS